MTTDLQTKLGELVLERPETMRYFEGLGLDYCCGGHRSLREACATAGLQTEAVLAGLATLEVPTAGTPSFQAWTQASLAALIQHILPTHHDYLRTELPRLRGFSARCARPTASGIRNWAASGRSSPPSTRI
jgi:regulator of cell morphogenesis and NO signaling